MSDRNTQPNVESIIHELRQGMDDITPVKYSGVGAIRKANETSDVLGRCGGSLRGKLCLLLSRFIFLPVVEQLNAHHASIVSALRQLQSELQSVDPEESVSAEERIAKLESELAVLKADRQL